MGMQETYMAAEVYSRMLPLMWTITVVFFWISIILLIALSAAQVILERRRTIVETKRDLYIGKIHAMLYSRRIDLEVHDKLDYYALADAIAQINTLLMPDDRGRIYEIVAHTGLDTYLIERYQSSYLVVKKKFFFTKLLYIASPSLKSFFAQIMLEQNEFYMQEYALYGYASLAEDAADLHQISRGLEMIYALGVSLKFCEFVYREALGNLSAAVLESFAAQAGSYDITILKSLVAAIGETRRSELEKGIRILYGYHPQDDMFVATFIRAMHEMECASCSLIREHYLSPNTVVRIVIAKVGLDVCGSDAVEFLYLYWFDANYYVRKNLFAACLHHGITHERILEIVTHKAPAKIDDHFFRDALTSYHLEVGFAER